MVFASGLLGNCPGLVHFNQPKELPFRTQRCNRIKFYDHNAVQPISRGGIGFSFEKRSGKERVNSVGKNYYPLSYDNNIAEEPLWLSCIKEAIWALRSLFIFLVEQPSQLKYIEWPSFQNTLKTATLTLVLVALLIVALSSVDSLLSYLLALLLRRTP